MKKKKKCRSPCSLCHPNTIPDLEDNRNSKDPAGPNSHGECFFVIASGKNNFLMTGIKETFVGAF